MPKSKITSKNQTTVPREVRETLGVGPADLICWELLGNGEARVTAAGHDFLKLRGSIRVGPGSVEEDIRKARAMRGREGV